MTAESKVFTHSEVSAHNSSEDCWVIINGKVYNVTSYLNEHPGGDDVLLGQAGVNINCTLTGKDASEEFEDVGHGSAARLMLDEFYVGEVDPSIKPPTDDANNITAPAVLAPNKPSESTYNNYMLLYFLLALAILGSGVGIHLFHFTS